MKKPQTNGWKLTVLMWAIPVIMALIGSYFTAQLSIAAQIADRPTRTEMEEKVGKTEKNIQRELDDIKRQQERILDETRKLGDRMTDYLLRKGGR